MIAVAAMLLSSGLYEQAVSRVLAERFAGVEYVLMDSVTGRVVASNWSDWNEPVPVGSLTKPFLAAAIPRDREIVCQPGKCWLPRGHGRVRMVDAIAWSCNEWFLRQATYAGSRLPDVQAGDIATLIGLRGDWRIAPVALARAYIQLVNEVEVAREGMRRAAAHGTAQRIAIGALAKTGTASCSHQKRGPGDGLVVALWPDTRPRYLLMVRVHGTTGASAAATAGQILRVVRDGR